MTTLTLTNVSHDLASLEMAGRLAHLVEDPPVGSDDAFDSDEVLRRVAAIRRLLDDTVLTIVFADEGGEHVTK